jgi:integrase
MNPRRGERVLGPWIDRKGWRVVIAGADGRRVSKIFDNRADADAYAEEAAGLIESTADDHTTETALEMYRVHLADVGNKRPCKPDTIRQTCWAIASFFDKPMPLRLLNPRRCEAMYAELRSRPTRTGKPMSVDAHRNTLSQVKTFLNWCVAKRWLASNPAANVRGVGERRPGGKSLGKNDDILTIDETRAFYQMAIFRAERGDEGAIAVLVALLLGLRASEIVALRVRDLNATRTPCDTLSIPKGKTKAARRKLEVPEELRLLFVRCCEGKPSDAHIFEADGGGAHWRDWIRKNVKRLCKDAGVPEATAHQMRKLLAEIATERGLAGHLVAATLGHEDFDRVTVGPYATRQTADTGARRRGLTVLAGGIGK